MTPSHRLYANANIALLTRHGKQRVLASILHQALGCQLTHVSDFDTDQLGSFSRDIPRAGTQLEAARQKARIGMSLAKLHTGLASEGAFLPDPVAGVLPWNLELIVFIDEERELEIVGAAQGAATFAHIQTDHWQALEAFARQQGFPEQYLVVRPQQQDDPRIRKDITSWTALRTAFDWATRQSATGEVFIETDGRAHANPRRMANIAAASQDLVNRILSLCPQCGMPGYWITEHIGGLPCGACGLPTREIQTKRYQCSKCDHHELRPLDAQRTADPARCDYCNP